LAEQEAEVYRTAFEKEKELSDRALKLAEAGNQNRIGSYKGYWVGLLRSRTSCRKMII